MNTGTIAAKQDSYFDRNSPWIIPAWCVFIIVTTLERAAAQDKYKQVINDAVRRLRLHGVIPLYVGAEDFARIRVDVYKSSPLLIGAMEEIWLLQNAPIPDTAKSALFAAANHGMNRW